jgi:hypothetical protein
MAGRSRRRAQQRCERDERVDFHGNLDFDRLVDIDRDDNHDDAFVDRDIHTVEQFVIEQSNWHLRRLDGADQIWADAGRDRCFRRKNHRREDTAGNRPRRALRADQ